MNENGEIGTIYSWPVIIIALFIFWPVGLYLLYKRVSCDKKTAMGIGKIVCVIGAVFYSIAGLGALVSFGEGFGSDDITAILFFVIAGFALRKFGKKIKKEAEEVKKYLSIIINCEQYQIDSIASSMGKSYSDAKKDIQNMINKGYLKGAYIDEGTRQVVVPKKNKTQEIPTPVLNSITTVKKEATTKVVSCSCCGANNTIVGNIGECEYCGSPLKG